MKRSMLIIFALTFLLTSSGLINAQVPSVINGGILNGRAKSLPKPEYPDDVKAAGISGIVKIAVVIDGEGNVVSTEPVYDEEQTVVLSDGTARTEPAELPHPLLVSAALEAAKDAKFAPTLLQDSPVSIKGVLVYRFGSNINSTGLTSPPPPSPSSIPEMVRGGVLNGKARSLPKPAYPPAARAVAAGGAVTVQVLIDESGSVISADAVSGHPLLRAAAVSAARRAVFSPTMLSGTPVKVSGVLTYVFVPPDAKQH